MSDFILACHPEDIELNGMPITNIEHANDIDRLCKSRTSRMRLFVHCAKPHGKFEI
jgi:hypothetical protein